MGAPIETLRRDFVYGLRALRKSPGFTVIAVLLLALGIGANSAVFSVVNAVLLRSLPYPEAQRIVFVGHRADNDALYSVSMLEFDFWKKHAGTFEAAAGYRGAGEQSLARRGGTLWIRTVLVSTDFFRTLGIQPALGREFTAQETISGATPAIILSDALWRRDFGGDGRILGASVVLDNNPYVVVGVLPADFWFPQAADAFLPLRSTRGLTDAGMNTQMIARLKPGVSLAKSQAEVAALTESFRAQYRQPRAYRGLALTSYQRSLTGDVRLNLLLLFGAAGILLLIACSNLASLLLARQAGRSKEAAVRMALGSSRGALFRQFLLENLLLAAMGSAAGLALAYWVIRAAVSFVPFHLPASSPIRLDVPVLIFALGIALATSIIFALAAFLTGSRLDLHSALKSGVRSTGDGSSRQRARSVLVVAEVALSVALLVSASLLIQTLYHLHQERLGFSPEGLVTFRTPVAPEVRRDAAAVLNFQSSLLERLQTVPGIHTVAAVNELPLDGFWNIPTQREGHTEQSIGGMEIRLVTPAYFEAMRIRVVGGRPFTADDRQGQPAVAIVNEALARRWWPAGNAVGDRLVIGRLQGRDFPEIQDGPRQVAGIVADTKTYRLQESASPTVYLPFAQASPGLARVGAISWIVRADRRTGLAQELRTAVADAQPQARVLKLQAMEEIVASASAGSRFDSWLFGGFAVLALVLTAIGVYGLLAFSVAQRRHEIGTRIALGAGRGDILRLVLRHGLLLIFAGLVLGTLGSVAATRWLRSLLYGVRPGDPLSFAAVALVLVGAGLLASYLPARRAAKVDPISALRCD